MNGIIIAIILLILFCFWLLVILGVYWWWRKAHNDLACLQFELQHYDPSVSDPGPLDFIDPVAAPAHNPEGRQQAFHLAKVLSTPDTELNIQQRMMKKTVLRNMPLEQRVQLMKSSKRYFQSVQHQSPASPQMVREASNEAEFCKEKPAIIYPAIRELLPKQSPEIKEHSVVANKSQSIARIVCQCTDVSLLTLPSSPIEKSRVTRHHSLK